MLNILYLPDILVLHNADLTWCTYLAASKDTLALCHSSFDSLKIGSFYVTKVVKFGKTEQQFYVRIVGARKGVNSLGGKNWKKKWGSFLFCAKRS